MKKLWIGLAILILALLFSACTDADDRVADEGDVVEISERFFITGWENIHLNAAQYIGRTIRYEGMFRTLQWPDTNEDFYKIYRYVPGCCSPDDSQSIGFIVDLNNIDPLENNTWVEVTGTLEVYERNAVPRLRVNVTNLTQPAVRGAEFVTQ